VDCRVIFGGKKYTASAHTDTLETAAAHIELRCTPLKRCFLKLKVLGSLTAPRCRGPCESNGTSSHRFAGPSVGPVLAGFSILVSSSSLRIALTPLAASARGPWSRPGTVLTCCDTRGRDAL